MHTHTPFRPALLQYLDAFCLCGTSKSVGLKILLARLKFCWHIFNFAGAVFEAKVAPAKDLRKQKFCWRAPENTITPRHQLRRWQSQQPR
jgi:hypothetical protein